MPTPTTDTPSEARALEKLSRKSLEVEVPKHLTLIRTVEAALAEARKSQTQDQQVRLQQAERELETLRQGRITGTFVPLKAGDILLLQGFVADMALKGKELGFELAVQLFLMSKAESCGTVYLALRQRGNLSQRYFASQEEVALLDHETLRELVRLYAEAFVLTEEERKNLSGAPRS